VQAQARDLVSLCADPSQEEIPLAAYREFCETVARSHGSNRISIVPDGHWKTNFYLREVLRGLPTTVSHLIDSCALQHVSPTAILLRLVEAASLPLVLPEEEHEFVGVPGQRYAAVVDRFERLVAEFMDSPSSAYLPNMRWIVRVMKVGRNILIEHSPQYYYDYLIERRKRYPSAALMHIERAFRIFSARDSDLRGSKVRDDDSALVTRVATAVNLSLDQSWVAYEASMRWMAALKVVSHDRRAASGPKKSIAKALV